MLHYSLAVVHSAYREEWIGLEVGVQLEYHRTHRTNLMSLVWWGWELNPFPLVKVKMKVAYWKLWLGIRNELCNNWPFFRRGSRAVSGSHGPRVADTHWSAGYNPPGIQTSQTNVCYERASFTLLFTRVPSKTHAHKLFFFIQKAEGYHYNLHCRARSRARSRVTYIK